MEAIDKLALFPEAGADCLYAPGIVEKIAAMVRAVAPKPVNILMMRPGQSVAELSDLGAAHQRRRFRRNVAPIKLATSTISN